MNLLSFIEAMKVLALPFVRIEQFLHKRLRICISQQVLNRMMSNRIPTLTILHNSTSHLT